MDKEIEKKIYQIRKILENFDKSDFDNTTTFYRSSGFPKGCCGDATDLIGLYLLKFHGIESEYVCGEGLINNSYQSHAWLLCQGYIIDITADQFNDIGYNLPKVLIQVQSDFHDSFDTKAHNLISVEYLKDTNISPVLSKVVSLMQV
ncbi:hypothetical protein QO189_03310 [Psychrobacter sp. Arc29]|uniref:hypothetical protein n=1 Tax=Psychrobacter sp. Arc29 TaxID=3046690 RepID=UPI00352D8DCC